MNSYSVTVSRAVLKAVFAAAAKKDVRFYLCGVLLETSGDKGRLVATDGAILHCMQFNVAEPSPALRQVIIPRVLVEQVLRHKLPYRIDDVEFVVGPDPSEDSPLRATIQAKFANGTVFSANAVEGTFPRYWERLREPPNGEIAHYDARLVEISQSAVTQLFNTKSAPLLHYNGTKPGMIARGNFLALVMPLRIDRLDSTFGSDLLTPLPGHAEISGLCCSQQPAAEEQQP